MTGGEETIKRLMALTGQSFEICFGVAVRDFESDKHKKGVPQKPQWSGMQLEEMARKKANIEKVAAYLEKKGAVTSEEVSQALRFERKAAQEYLRILRADGRVKIIRDRTGGKDVSLHGLTEQKEAA